MVDVVSVFGVIAGIVFLGFLAEIIFKKTNIPDILFLIGFGIIMSNYLNWADPLSFGEGSKLFTTFALVFILFQGSLNIDFRTLVKSLPKTFKLTILSFFLTVLIVSFISYFIIWKFTGQGDVLLSLMAGMMLAGTSSAVVIPLVSNVDIRDKYGSVLTLESALSDVLCIIGTLTIIEIINTGDIAASRIFNSIFSSFSMAIVVGVIVGIFWIVMLFKNELISKSYMLTIALVIGLYAFVESSFIGASGAIAALSFGLLLGNSKSILTLLSQRKRRKINPEEDEELRVIRNVLSPSAKNFYSEISFFVKTFFFVYLGILIDFSNTIIFVYGAFLTIGIYLIRPIAVKMVFRKDNLDEKERSILEILIPKGLAAAVLAGIAVQSGVLGESISYFVNLILSVVLLSIFMTSILVFFSERGWFRGFLPFLYKREEK